MIRKIQTGSDTFDDRRAEAGGCHRVVHGCRLAYQSPDASGRECLDLEASLVFEPDEWMAAYILKEKEPPKEVPTVNEVVRLIASPGGFLGGKSDGEPGVKTIWRGMERVASFAAGMKLACQMNNST